MEARVRRPFVVCDVFDFAERIRPGGEHSLQPEAAPAARREGEAPALDLLGLLNRRGATDGVWDGAAADFAALPDEEHAELATAFQ